ncbi:hypothetical protein HYH02_014093 [Chlamydomonas schloesseri]|uniref:HD/PDEase domain-containing protein n=1 Tax=Chlamydomonas schloesseri TaxID=2026947 RepID=A0A835STJ7_9CHLO|nr:hypothetical protein HYH02_014093 [Chlamydomonas schloesseri]|eukprot:KAG2429438.1 hypothetical protein HYH02_014093 [Chlamydomonas schloesseri]
MDDQVPFSQEAMRHQDMVFTAYNFSSGGGGAGAAAATTTNASPTQHPPPQPPPPAYAQQHRQQQHQQQLELSGATAADALAAAAAHNPHLLRMSLLDGSQHGECGGLPPAAAAGPGPASEAGAAAAAAAAASGAAGPSGGSGLQAGASAVHGAGGGGGGGGGADASFASPHADLPGVGVSGGGGSGGLGMDAALVAALAAAGGGGGGGEGEGSPGAVAAAAAGQQQQRRRRGKIFSDPVHEIIRLDPIHVDVIDTPQYQRLRELHQLGLTHLVFPGAVHSRFEHSLGVGFKAFEVADRIYRTQGRQLGMELDDIKRVSLAGLCHDLGHGPFSHVWEYEFLPRRLGSLQEGGEQWAQLKDWEHENMSAAILSHLVDENHIEDISGEDIRVIQSLIKGDAFAAEGYLYDIVANKRNGVDVDKFDYLQRDALMCGVEIGCSFRRLLMLTKVLDNQITYKWSEYSNLWNLFHTRASMFRQVYLHRKTKAVEFMVCDALVEADQALGFSRACANAEDFCMLNDTLLSQIENYGLLTGDFRSAKRQREQRQQRGDGAGGADPLAAAAGAEGLDNGTETRMARAQAIIRRLRKRELYTFCNQANVPQELLRERKWDDMKKKFTAAEVAACHPGLRPDDVIVSTSKIDFTAGGGNPLDSIRFFHTSDDVEAFPMDPRWVLGIIPEFHQEHIVRAYTPRTEPGYKEKVEDAFQRWCRRYFGSNAQMATPARRRPPPPQPDALTAREAARTGAIPYRGAAAAGGPPAASMRPPAGPPGSASITVGPAAVRSSAAAGSVAGRGGGGGGAGPSLGDWSAGGDGVGGSGGAGGGTPTRSTPVLAGGAAAATGSHTFGGVHGPAAAAAASEGGAATGAGASTADGGTGKGVKRARGLFSQEEESA